jgi:hypothetical protein
MAAVRPQWTAVRDARSALGLEGRTLLHAGPPLADPTRPPIPMLNAAVLSCLHEGWARTPDEAERLLSSGAVRLEPSHTRSVATPLGRHGLAQGPRSPRSPTKSAAAATTPTSAPGAGPQQRFGTRDPPPSSRDSPSARAVLAPGLQPSSSTTRSTSSPSPAPPSAKATSCINRLFQRHHPPPRPPHHAQRASQTPPRPPSAPSPKRRSTSSTFGCPPVSSSC